jgi:hypothetical protein
VDISVPHLVRTVRRFVDEEGRAGGKVLTAEQGPVSPAARERHPESAVAEGTTPKAPVIYRVSEQPSARVQEEEFAKQLRLARYLAAGGSPPARPIEAAPEAKAPKRGRPVAKAGARATGKKPREEELAKERRRFRQVGRYKASSSRGRSEKAAIRATMSAWRCR